MAINKELFKGCSKTIILQLLARQQLHGYEISVKLKEASYGELDITEGSLYPILHSLEADKCIEANWEISKGNRKKKVYSLTTKGRKSLKAKTKEWRHFLSTMDLLLSAKREHHYGYAL